MENGSGDGRTHSVRLVVLGCVAVTTLLVSPFIGLNWISPSDVLEGTLVEKARAIFWSIRVPRVLLAFMAGLGLSVSGMVFQALFRNPLASPYTLGISSGASLGAAVYVVLGLSGMILFVPGISIFAFLGASLTVILVYGVTRIRGKLDPATLLLAGVAVSFTASSLILFLQYVADFTETYRIVRWLMGSLSVVQYEEVVRLFPFILVGGVLIGLYLPELNLYLAGEDIARTRGVSTERMKHTLFFGVSLLVGGIVAVCGPLGFVGLMVPHMCRMIMGPDHRYLFPACILFGGSFLVICDTVARILLGPAELPTGILTSLLGGPFFLYLLLTGEHKSGFLSAGANS